MRRFTYIYIVLMLLCSMTPLFSQQLVLKTYDRTSGLPSNYIMSICQDRDGFIWFGTDKGLSRYDGRSFITYTTQQGLPDNFVTHLAQNSDGSLWLSMYDHGVARFDGVNFQSFTTSEGLNSNAISYIDCDRSGQVYFASSSGLCSYFNEKFTFESPLGDFSTIAALPNGSVLFNNGDTLFRSEPLEQSPLHRRRLEMEHAGRIIAIGAFPKPSQYWQGAELFLGLGGGVSVYKFQNDSTLTRVAQYPIDGRISEVIAEGDSVLWCATYSNGINKISKDTVIHYDTKQGLLQQRVEKMMFDYEGNLWISTFGSGVQKLSTTSVSIFRESDGLPSNFVSSIFEDKKHTMWFGTSRGLSFLGSDSIHHTALNEVDMREIRAITQDSYGEYYIGNFEYLFGPLSFKQLQEGKPLKKIRIGYGVSGISAIEDSQLHAHHLPSAWVGTFGEGVSRLIGDDSIVYQVKDGLCSNIIEDIIPGINNIWFPSHNNGVTCFSDNHFQSYSMKDGLPSNSIYAIYEESNRLDSAKGNRVWFGTDLGLTLLENGVTRFYDFHDGLLGVPVVNIFSDTVTQQTAGSALWVVTPKGLHHLQNDRIELVGAFSFNQTGDLSINDVLLSSDNSLWCGTPQGLYKINLSSFHSVSIPPKVAIINVEQDTTLLFKHELVELTQQLADKYELPYDKNNLSFDFAGLGFVNEAGIKFSYILEPLDKAWSQPDGDNHIQFRNLGDGEYRFMVIAINGDGISSTTPALFTFRILPPFWKRWWFVTLLAFAITGTTVGSVRLVVKRKLRKQAELFERQQEIQQERDRISRDLHDNVGAQLVNIISGLELAGRYSDVQLRETKSVLDSLKDDTRVTMALLRETIWALQSSEMVVEKFAQELEQYIRKQLKYHPHIKLNVRYDSNTSTILRPVEAINLLRIVQEALTNSLKHASPSTIDIRLHIDQDAILHLLLWNDGCLKEQHSEPSGGRGIPNMERRAKEIGGTFQFIRHDEDTTSVEVRVPLNKIVD